MNNDLISRSRLRMNFIQAVEDENPELYGEIILDLIDNAPTVEERPQGKWAFDEKGYFYCNKCGKYPHDQYSTTDFCPNCGAEMKQD